MPGRSQVLGQLLPRVHRQIADLAVQIWHAYKSLGQSRVILALYYFLFFRRNQVEDRGAESKWMLLACLFGSQLALEIRKFNQGKFQTGNFLVPGLINEGHPIICVISEP